MKSLAIVVSALVLSACCSNPSVPPTVPRPKPAASMLPCQPFPEPQSPSAADLVRSLMDGADAYGLCRQEKQALVEWINRGN